jgi:hypothetical protein
MVEVSLQEGTLRVTPLTHSPMTLASVLRQVTP